ncbi:hypothetical protein [Rhizobium sp. L1K21]|uniref:hypothetical protein n=1 Tax=Rhizobium sp. L1K21 TaxID=2954933 RepID=UPI002093E773|nr:hypothetical protein [Rhizobium sp. L1K21]MCO6184591.1 hypothetical protein [Rhizobium sp. L1K21]
MTRLLKSGRLAEQFRASASTPIPGDIHLLVQEAIERTMHQEATRLAVSGDSEGLASLGRSIAVDEGHLLEAVVIALARRNPNMAVLSGIKLPILDSALAIIEANKTAQVGALTLDPEGRAKRSYYPDLVLANRSSQQAVVIDVKRSITSYLGGSKLTELQGRMQAAGLALPDILWRDHSRLAVRHVSIAIIDGSKTDNDTSDGIWPLQMLDHLTGVPGAGIMAQSAMSAYRRGISNVWMEAIRSISEGGTSEACKPVDTATPCEAPTLQDKRLRLQRNVVIEKPRVRTVTVGLFRPDAPPVH